MDINMITEPKWKSYIVQTNDAIFTPEQCKMIIDAGRNEPKQDAYVGGDKKIKSGIIDTKTRTSHISWIPFSKMEGMYKDIEKLMKTTNGNHFGFNGMQITEMAQYTEYPEGGFYEWHVDNDVNFVHEPPVRKISMTCLLSPESEFEGGDLELMSENKFVKLKQGQAIFFASFIRHRVKPVIRGNRKSLVMWFGGTPFK
jgi:PKHD-type hydroxylase|tara:strand:+ start:578 stop:1174 length:597 start_codon:yes stop_codon:yes gene_type:complete